MSELEHNVNEPQNRLEDAPDTQALGKPSPEPMPRTPVSRRSFLHQIGGASVAGVALGTLGTVLLPARRTRAEEIGPETGTARNDIAYNRRIQAASDQRNQPLPDHPCNGDDKPGVGYPDGRISYGKALPHDGNGIVDPAAYAALRGALATGHPAAFENIPLLGDVRCRPEGRGGSECSLQPFLSASRPCSCKSVATEGGRRFRYGRSPWRTGYRRRLCR